MLDEMCFGLDSKYDVIILLYCDYRITTQQLTLYSHEWPRQNFSLQHQYSIKQTSYENLQKLTRGFNNLIQHQILQTNITRTIWQTVRRITNEILGVKRLILQGTQSHREQDILIFLRMKIAGNYFHL